MDYFVELLNNKYSVAIGTLSSIVSLVLTVLVFYGLKKIKNFYIFIARIPNIIFQLEGIASCLSEHLNSFSGYTPKTFLILADAETFLKSLKNITNGSLRVQAKVLIKNIQGVSANPPFLDRLFNFYLGKSFKYSDKEAQRKSLESIHLEIYKIAKECNENYENSRWER